MIKYTYDVPEEINELRLTDWCKKNSSFYPSQIEKTITKNGKLIALPVRTKKPMITYVKWLNQEKKRINKSPFAERVQIVELLSLHNEPMIALFPFKMKCRIANINRKNELDTGK